MAEGTTGWGASAAGAATGIAATWAAGGAAVILCTLVTCKDTSSKAFVPTVTRKVCPPVGSLWEQQDFQSSSQVSDVEFTNHELHKKVEGGYAVVVLSTLSSESAT